MTELELDKLNSLIDNDRKYSRLLKNAPLGVGILTIEGDILTCNQSMAVILGYAPDDLKIVNSLNLFIKPTDRDLISKKLANEGGIRNQEFELLRKDGTSFPAMINLHPFSHGNQKAVLAVVQDMAAGQEKDLVRQNLEKKLRHAQKMDALSTLAGGIAHDLNNALGIILANAELLRTDFGPDSPAGFNLNLILKAANRSRTLVEQVMAFSRRTEEGFTSLNLDAMLREVIKILRGSLPATIEIRQDIRAGEVHIFADPTQVHQAILNLAANASQALPGEGGILEIKLLPVEFDDPRPTLCGILGPGKFLQLTIGDNGHGIDPGMLEKIFDPFFSGDPNDQRNGLGLSTVHGIMVNHGGGITVASQPGAGTSFHLLFPLVEDTPMLSAGSIHGFPQGTEHILFVDDEKDMVQSVTMIFQRLGYDVTSFSGGWAALEAIQKNPSSFDLLITDQTMPVMTGLELIKQARSLRPDLPVILCTGFSEAIDDTTKDSTGVNEILAKPVFLSVMGSNHQKGAGRIGLKEIYSI